MTRDGNSRHFIVKVSCKGHDWEFNGEGSSFKLAKKDAATKALLSLFNVQWEEPGNDILTDVYVRALLLHSNIKIHQSKSPKIHSCIKREEF